MLDYILYSAGLNNIAPLGCDTADPHPHPISFLRLPI